MEVEEWGGPKLAARLPARERVLVLFDTARAPRAAATMAEYAALEPEAPVPLARVRLAPRGDPRRAAYRIGRVPTLVYFEHGEELERVEALPRLGLSRRDLEEMFALVESLQEEPKLPRRMRGPLRR